jgi:hypothetical protein
VFVLALYSATYLPVDNLSVVTILTEQSGILLSFCELHCDAVSISKCMVSNDKMIGE